MIKKIDASVVESHEKLPGTFAIVVARYNESITGKLLSGALETLKAAGVADDDIVVAWVPGAWEIPLAAQRFAEKSVVSAVITLGCVIRGETTHDRYINAAVSTSLMQMSLDRGKPIAFGVLTVNTLDQAIHRSGGNVGNKGEEAALAAIEMVRLLGRISDSSSGGMGFRTSQ
jgi:6,7-dimethyl-8-ribityllumazine synthase